MKRIYSTDPSVLIMRCVNKIQQGLDSSISFLCLRSLSLALLFCSISSAVNLNCGLPDLLTGCISVSFPSCIRIRWYLYHILVRVDLDPKHCLETLRFCTASLLVLKPFVKGQRTCFFPNKRVIRSARTAY